MALLFSIQPSESVWGLNHNYFRFRSNLALTVNNCAVEIEDDDSGETIAELTLFPDPEGYFLFDTLAIIRTIFTNKDHDDHVYDTGVTNEDDSLFRVLNIDFSVTFTDSATTDGVTKTVSFVKGFMQPDGSLNTDIISTDPDAGESRKVLIPDPVYYWVGYPFDFAYIEEITNKIKRFNITNGSTVDLYQGDTIAIDDDEKGFYIKWFNNRGGFSYWRFSCRFQQEVSSKSKGTYQKPFQDIQSPPPLLNESYDLGREFANTVTVNSQFDLEDEALLSSLLYSDEVYYFNGTKGSSIQDGIDFFRRIKLDTNKVTFNTKTRKIEVTLKFTSDMRIDLLKILS